MVAEQVPVKAASRRAAVAVAMLASTTLGAAVTAVSSRSTVARLRTDVRELTARVDVLDGTATTASTKPTATTKPIPGPVCNIAPADGQAAIMAAITRCRDGSTVRFPPDRTYHQDEPIMIYERTDLIIDANRSTFVSSAPNDNSKIRPQWWLMRSRGITLTNLTTVGNFHDTGTPNINRGAVTSNAGVAVSGGRDIVVDRLTVRDVFGDGLFTADAQYHDQHNSAHEFPVNLRVTNISVKNAARHCLSVSQGTHVWVENGTLDRCFLDGIDAERDLITDPLADLHFLNLEISNYFGVGIVVPIGGPDATPVDGVEIRGNTMPTLATASVCNQAIVVAGYEGQYFANVNIVANTIYAYADGARLVGTKSGTVRDNKVTHPPDAAPATCGVPAGQDVSLLQSPSVVATNNGPNAPGARR